MPDNVPQWSCQATIRGASVGLEFEADDAGVIDITAQVPAGTDPATAKAVFSDLVSSMDAFSTAHSALLHWIAAWNDNPGQVSTGFGAGRAAIESDATWIGLYLSRVPR